MIFHSKQVFASLYWKTCRICKSTLPVSEFYSGLVQCKSCYIAKVQKYRQNNVEKIRKYEHKRGVLPHRVKARKEYMQTEAGKAAHTRACAAWYSRDKRRQKCHNAVAKALMRGSLIRQGCESCGYDIAQAHHDNYDEPLNIRWLCQSCHNQWHNENEYV